MRSRRRRQYALNGCESLGARKIIVAAPLAPPGRPVRFEPARECRGDHDLPAPPDRHSQVVALRPFLRGPHHPDTLRRMIDAGCRNALLLTVALGCLACKTQGPSSEGSPNGTDASAATEVTARTTTTKSAAEEGSQGNCLLNGRSPPVIQVFSFEGSPYAELEVAGIPLDGSAARRARTTLLFDTGQDGCGTIVSKTADAAGLAFDAHPPHDSDPCLGPTYKASGLVVELLFLQAASRPAQSLDTLARAALSQRAC